eukprot:gene9314-12550_t
MTSTQSDKEKKRKYLLFSKEDGRSDAIKPCAFFSSLDGCRNGEKCKFSHKSSVDDIFYKPESNGDNKTSKSVVQLEPIQDSSVKKSKKNKNDHKSNDTSQENSNDTVEKLKEELANQQRQFALAQQLLQQEIEQVKASKVAIEASHQRNQKPKIEETPVKFQQPQSSQKLSNFKLQNKEKQVRVDDAAIKNQQKSAHKSPVQPIHHAKVEQPFVNPKYLSQPVALPQPSVTQHSTSSKKSENNLASVHSFVRNTSQSTTASRLPVEMKTNQIFVDNSVIPNILATSGSKHALYGPTVVKNGKQSKKAPKLELPTAEIKVAPTLSTVAEMFNPEIVNFSKLPWELLVQQTKAHPKYTRDYTFDQDPSWITANPYGEWCVTKDLPLVLAVDCEMCEATDPVNGSVIHNALVRISIVNALCPDEVIIDTLVQPGLPITDMRTHIHGISEESLRTTNYTLRHVQANLLKICSDRTIIIGHSIHGDLKALHFAHHNVIDTAYLYTVMNEGSAAPALRDITDQILQRKLPDTHDSVEDARAALYSAALVLLKGPQRPVIRSNGNGIRTDRIQGMNAAAFADIPHLFVHRIPDFCNESIIEDMIISYTKIKPVKVNPINRGETKSSNQPTEPKGKTVVEFPSEDHVKLAFKTIEGPERPDKQNKPQKRIYLKSGGYICVRLN